MNSDRGFSLIELLVSMSIFIAIMLMLSQMMSTTLNSWQRASDKQLQFQEARAAFDSMTTRLSTSELNPYWGYEFGNGAANSPTSYSKISDLHFVSGRAAPRIGGTGTGTGNAPALLSGGIHPGHAVFFHGAFGISEESRSEQLGTLLNCWGYFLEFGPDTGRMADFLQSEGKVKPRYRFRLMELQLPAENLSTFKNVSGRDDQLDLDEANSSANVFSWFRDGVSSDRATPLAENIIAMVITPLPGNKGRTSYLASYPAPYPAPNFYYDSRAFQHETNLPTQTIELSKHQLPPLIKITLVAIGEGSAVRLEDEFGTEFPDLGIDHLFQKVSAYQEDIETLETILVERNISFRIFTNTVKLRNARWSEF